MLIADRVNIYDVGVLLHSLSGRAYKNISQSGVKGVGMKCLKYGILGGAAIFISGCGSFGAAIMNGPFCPYQGVHLDLYSAIDWSAIKATTGFIIPFAILDLPFSFVVDTLTLGSALNADNGVAQCPRSFS